METNETGFVGNCWEAPSVHCQTTSLNLDLSPIREFQQCFIRSVQRRAIRARAEPFFLLHGKSKSAWEFSLYRLDASACINKAIRSNWHFIITTPFSPPTNNTATQTLSFRLRNRSCLRAVADESRAGKTPRALNYIFLHRRSVSSLFSGQQKAHFVWNGNFAVSSLRVVKLLPQNFGDIRRNVTELRLVLSRCRKEMARWIFNFSQQPPPLGRTERVESLESVNIDRKKDSSP